MNSTFSSCSDDVILKFIRENNDESAFAELYNRYFRLLFNYAYSKVNDQFVAQEIVQELFISFWQQRHRSLIQACRPYLFACLKKLIISHYRKEYTRSFHYSQWEIQAEETTELTEQQVFVADLQHRYEEGLHLLPPKCREVFLLSRKGHSNREVALQMAISEKTVEQHITKALHILKGFLKEHLVYALILFSIL